jgi:hypothetical protein
MAVFPRLLELAAALLSLAAARTMLALCLAQLLFRFMDALFAPAIITISGL